MATKGGRKM